MILRRAAELILEDKYTTEQNCRHLLDIYSRAVALRDRHGPPRPVAAATSSPSVAELIPQRRTGISARASTEVGHARSEKV